MCFRIEYIQPGKPQQNAYVERYNRTVRYDWLRHYLFDSITEVQEFATRWLWTYNHERPNMALGAHYPKTKAGFGRLTISTFSHSGNWGDYQDHYILAKARIIPRSIHMDQPALPVQALGLNQQQVTAHTPAISSSLAATADSMYL